jgi:hypothetical protein
LGVREDMIVPNHVFEKVDVFLSNHSIPSFGFSGNCAFDKDFRPESELIKPRIAR